MMPRIRLGRRSAGLSVEGTVFPPSAESGLSWLVDNAFGRVPSGDNEADLQVSGLDGSASHAWPITSPVANGIAAAAIRSRHCRRFPADILHHHAMDLSQRMQCIGQCTLRLLSNHAELI